MGGFFSVRLAPGIRVSASSRGLRAHIGPRAARLHVGGGGTGISTGAGPFTWYEPVSGSGGRRNSRPYYSGPTSAEVTRASKAQQAELLDNALRAIEKLHRQSFPAAVRPQAVLEPMPEFADLLAAAEKAELNGISRLRFSARRDARNRAFARAQEEAQELAKRAETDCASRQEQLDRVWAELLENREDTVIGVLAQAFEDNEAPVAPVGVQGNDVSLVVLAPSIDAVPDRFVAFTEAGNLSIRKMTKTMRNDYYRLLVAGHVLVSVKEAFAVAPSLQRATVVVVRRRARTSVQPDATEPIFCSQLARDDLARQHWDSVDAWQILEQCGTESLYEFKGATREFQALDLSDQPDLQRLAAAFSH